MSNATRILVVEDNRNDYELAQREIQSSVEACVFKRVETQQEYLEELKSFQPDIILCDYSLPTFDGMTALRLAREQSPLTPLIIWTGSISEDVAVECMMAGAANYVIKDNLKRLGPAVLRAIEGRNLILENKQAQESRFQALLENGLDSISLLSAEGILLWENPSIDRPLGYEPGEFIDHNIFELMHPEDLGRTTNLFAQVVREAGSHQRSIFRLKHKDGTWRWIEARATNKLDDPNIAAVVINYRDISELKRVEGKYQDIVESSPMGIFQSTPGGRFINANSAMARIYGYNSPDELIGSVLDIGNQLYLKPQDRLAFTQLLETADAVGEFEMENVRRDGTIIWTSTTARAVRDLAGNILYYEGFMQDVTERKHAQAQIDGLLSLNEKILNYSPLGILTYKQTGECVFANNQAASIVGTSVENLKAQNLYTIESWKKSGLYDMAKKAMATKTPTSGDIHHISTFGKESWLTVHCVTFQAIEEEHLLVSVLDITERKLADQELQQKNNDLRLLNMVNNAMIRGQDLAPSIDLLTRELRRIFSAVGSTLYMLSADQRTITMHQYAFSPELENKVEKLIGFKIPKIEVPIREGGHFHNALLTKQCALTTDPHKIQEWIMEFVDTKFLPPLAKAAVRKLVPHIYKLLNIRSTIIVPLIAQDVVLGFLDISSPNLMTNNDLKRLETIGEQLTLLIQSHQASERVRKSEEFLQGIQNSLSAHVAILNEQGVIVQVNEAWREFADQNGLQSADYGIGMNYLAVCEASRGADADIAWDVAEAIRQVLSGVRVQASLEYPCHSPKENRWFVVHITCFDDGQQPWVILAHENITERKLVEDELRQSEIRYRSVVENQTEFIVRWKPDGSRTFVNDAYCRYFGLTREEALGKRFVELIHEEDRQIVDQKIDRLLSGASSVETDNHRVIRFDGSICWNEWTDQAIYDEAGQLIEIMAVGRDITERKKAEIALLQSQARYQGLFDKSPTSLWEEDFSVIKRRLDTLREEGVTDFREYFDQHPDEVLEFASLVRIIDVNKTTLDLFRAQNKESLLKDLRTLMKEDVYQHFREELLGLMSPARSFVWEGPDKTFDGQALEVIVTGTIPTGYEEDWSRVIVSIVDITERKRAESELRISEERFRQLANNIEEVFWMTEAKTGKELYTSPAAEKIWGVSIEALLHDPDLYINSILPADRPLVLRGIEREKNGEKVEMEYRITRPDGSIRWIWDRAFPIFDEHGNVKTLAGISADITERKLAEEQLRKLSLAVEQSGSSIVITDLNGNIEYVNPQFIKTTGYSLEEALGQNPRILKTGYTSQQDYKRLWDTIKAGEEWRGEFHNRKKNGELYWEQATISPIQNQHGELTHFIAVKEDITERKQDELKIQHHLAELEALYENGLSIGRLLEPKDIGEQIIQTFARYLSWHHVAIRLLDPETDKLELIAFNLPGLSDDSRAEMEVRLRTMVNKVGQGLSGRVIQTGKPIRTGNVQSHPQYVNTHSGILSGLYMPLRIADRVIGCISVESDEADAFSEEDERLLATLANQAAVAFQNARLYQSVQQELHERKRAQEALWTSESHYRQLADSITDILFELDQDLRYTHWNKASEMFSGIPAEDAIGKSMHEIWGDGNDVFKREEIYRSVLHQRQAKMFEIEVNLRGQKRDLEISAYPSARGVSVVARDVTERKVSETVSQKRIELIEYSTRHSLDEVMQKVLDDISELTQSHIGFLHLVEADQQTINMQTWSTETLKTFCNFDDTEKHFPLDQAGVWADAVRQRHSVIHDKYETLLDKKGLPDGHAAVHREMVIPIIRNENVVAVIGVGNKEFEYTKHDVSIAERFADYAWDIMERRRIESELAQERNQLARRVEERTADLSRANSNLARALRVKDEFLANMSHELRTPLNAILGLSESLSEQVAGPLNEKQFKYLSTINESGHHLLSLINDILDLAKIDAGQITLDINKVDINSVCQASLRMIKQLAQKKNQEVSFAIDPNLGWMWADERRLKQMIVNLLSNAVKFTPDSGQLGLEVHGDQDGNKITLSVWDQGIGISENDIQRLFKPFVQLDASLAREATGTGLGLALVAQMAQMHGGSVTVESRVGQGSRFTIMLPWEPALAGESNSRLRSTGKFRAIKPNEVRPTILLVEDTQEVVMMLVDYLEMAGFNMVTAQDGLDGLTQAKIAHPDLILMDIQMPRMDGFEATKKLRNDPEFKETPIIALTALAMPNDRQRCIDAGMNEYLSKPVNLKSLSETIKALLFNQEPKPS